MVHVFFEDLVFDTPPPLGWQERSKIFDHWNFGGSTPFFVEVGGLVPTRECPMQAGHDTDVTMDTIACQDWRDGSNNSVCGTP